MSDLGKITITVGGAYNSSTEYEALTIVSYNNGSYISKQSTTGNAPTNTTYWQKIGDSASVNLADTYDSTKTYAKDEIIVYEGILYAAKAAITTAESWTAAHWEQKTVKELLAGINTALNNKISGHTIEDEENTYAQRSKIVFSGGVEIEDDPTNDATVINVVGGSSKKNVIYGFHLDQTESNPANMISYNVQYDGKDVANKDYTAAAVNLSTGVMNPGSWNLTDDFFIPKSCMLKYNGTVDYYLDEDDETKKADGTASDVANTSYGGNAMMEWGRDGKKIYYKIVPDSTPTNGATFYVANYQADNDFHAWSFYDCDGKEIDHFYTPKYNGSLVSSKLRSISGQTPCNNQTGANEVTYATANNVNGKNEWYTEVLADRMLINILLLMIGKNCNTQAVFGQGYTTGGSVASSLASTGTLNGKGQWYGSSTNNSKTAGVKVFGMEHWWGNVWRRVAGYLNMSGTIKYKLTYAKNDGTNQIGYDSTGANYLTVDSGTMGGTSGGYTNVMVFNGNGLFNKTQGGSESTYYCDGVWFNNSQANYAAVGGACHGAAYCGAVGVLMYDTFSRADWAIGAALSCKPLAA